MTHHPVALYLCEKHSLAVIAPMIAAVRPDVIISADPDLSIAKTKIIHLHDLLNPNTILTSDRALLDRIEKSLTRNRRRPSRDHQTLPWGFVCSQLFDKWRKNQLLDYLGSSDEIFLGAGITHKLIKCCQIKPAFDAHQGLDVCSDWIMPHGGSQAWKLSTPSDLDEKPHLSTIDHPFDTISKIFANLGGRISNLHIWTTYDRNVASIIDELSGASLDRNIPCTLHTVSRFHADFYNEKVLHRKNTQLRLIDIQKSSSVVALNSRMSSLMNRIASYGSKQQLRKVYKKLIQIRDHFVQFFMSNETLMFSYFSDQLAHKYAGGHSYAEDFADPDSVHIFLNLRWPEFVGARHLLEGRLPFVYGVQVVLHSNDPRYLLPIPQNCVALSKEELQGFKYWNSKLSCGQRSVQCRDEHLPRIALPAGFVPDEKDPSQFLDLLSERQVGFVGQGFPPSLTYELLLSTVEVTGVQSITYFPHPSESRIISELLAEGIEKKSVSVDLHFGVPASDDFAYFGVSSNVLFAMAAKGFVVGQFLVPHVVEKHHTPFVKGDNAFWLRPLNLLEREREET